jgi:hypothetical protein
MDRCHRHQQIFSNWQAIFSLRRQMWFFAGFGRIDWMNAPFETVA